jgi:hypothetical protein
MKKFKERGKENREKQGRGKWEREWERENEIKLTEPQDSDIVKQYQKTKSARRGKVFS